MIDGNARVPFLQTLLVTLIGMATVIVGLVILIFLIKALVKATDGLGKKKKADAPQVVIPPMKAFTIRSDEDDAQRPADGELVAAIMAAINCAMGENASSFVVRRIRRV